MNFSGARIYTDGMIMDRESEEKVQNIINEVKKLSPASEIGLRFIKAGKSYEGLLWGHAYKYPMGAYQRGSSLAGVLDSLYIRVKKETAKISKLVRVQKRPDDSEMAI
jgi:hypothetical protein